MQTEKPFFKVGTHHGKFHADEVMATAILKRIFNLEVIRTRDPQVLKTLDLVYDVGGGEFDHHDAEKKLRGNGRPYAACGLIWKEFGRQVIAAEDEELREEEVERIFRQLDSSLMQGIDAVDNGLQACDCEVPVMGISAVISGFNPPWDMELSESNAFDEAVEVASAVLRNSLRRQISVLKAREKVVQAYTNRKHPKLLEMESLCPWGQALQELDKEQEVLFVIYPTRDGFTIQTVRKGGDTMEARKDLPKEWAGKRDEALSGIVGIPDAIFCHPGRFIAAARSYDSIMKMAELALTEPGDPGENWISRLLGKMRRRVRIHIRI